MPRFTGTLALLKLNDQALLRALDKQVTAILIEGTQEYVRTVASILPNWSGMQRASLRALADLVDIPIFASPVSGAPDRVAEGEAAGNARLVHENGVYFFEWTTNVFHLAYNELNNANLVGFHLISPGPYHAQRQARDAFLRTVNPKLRALKLNINSSLRVNNQRIG